MQWIARIRRSLKLKFMLLVLLLIVVLVSSIGYFSYYESSKTIRKDVSMFSDQILKQTNLNLNQYFLDYEYGFLVLGLSYEFEQWLGLGRDGDDEYDLYIMESRMESRYILSYISQHPELLSISIYNDNGKERLFRGNQAFVSLNHSVREEEWFSSVALSKGFEVFVHSAKAYENPSFRSVISMVKRFDFQGNSGLIKIDISPSRVLQILDQINLGANSTALISDGEGKPLLQTSGGEFLPDSGMMRQVSEGQAGSFYYKPTDEMVIFQTLPYTNWKTMVLVPYANVAEGVFRVRNFTAVVAAVNFLVAVLAVWLISSSLTSRLLRLKDWMRLTRTGNLDTRIAIGGTDEVAELGNAYNRMLDTLQESMNDLAESRLLQQQAVLSALQSQIHSHFTYNALESINAMANLVEHRQIMETAVALSDMLRYTSSYKQEFVPLADELKHVQDYIRIANIMYGDQIDLRIDMDESMDEIRCLKAVLQPLAENSMKHGFERTGCPMCIEIAAKNCGNGYIVILVRDSGSGFAPDKLAELQRRLALPPGTSDYRSISQVGLLNVHYRLRMHDRDGVSGLQIGNDPHTGGAVVTVMLRG